MQEACLACGHRITYPLYHPAPQPLAALNLPRSAKAAKAALRFPMNFRACAFCGHVFNVEFDYYRIPYEEDSNLMYNRGALWTEHMRRLVDVLVDEYDAAGKTLLDIGCGDGLFLKDLADRDLGCRCIGFEPGIESENARLNGLLVYKDYFHPERDLKLIRPDFLVCRHVIEHLDNPRDFVAGIAHWCNRYELYPVFLAEVPRIDRAVRQARLADFLYEHVSNFTELSFRTLFETSGFEVLDVQSCYGDEVAVALVRAQRLPRIAALRESGERFRQRSEGQRRAVAAQLDWLAASGKRAAFWGGTGKGAAFLNAFDVDADRFPLVVDSDRNKLGRFVPGTGQPLRAPEYLKEHPAEVIVITTRWRAKDILAEIHHRGIAYGTVLALKDGRLRACAGDELWEAEGSIRIEAPHPGVVPPVSLLPPIGAPGLPTV